jgi:hypothetical protein
LPLALVALSVAVGLSFTGVAIRDTLVYGCYFVIVILAPGALLWRELMIARVADSDRYRNVPLLRIEALVCGAALGYALEIPAYTVARAVGMPRGYVLVPIAVTAICLIRIVRRERKAHLAALGAGPTTALAVQMAYLVVWLVVMLFMAHPLRATRLVDPDEMFHLALVGELRHHFPATYPYVEYPGHLTYQWFVHAHMAASTWVTGLDPELVYRRFDPLTLSAVALLGVGVLAVRVSGNNWAAPLGVGVLLLVGSFDVTGSVIGEAAPEERFLQEGILMHSPTQTIAYVLAVPAMAICLDIAERRRLGIGQWVALAFIVAAISGAKVTFLPMFLCGFITVIVLTFLRRRSVAWSAIGGLTVTALGIVLSAWLLYDGDSQSLAWSPMQTTTFFMQALGLSGGGGLGLAVISVALLVMWLVPGVGSLALFLQPTTRWDPRVWWLVGASASGYGATLLLGHGGSSQLYFGRSASVMVAILGVWGVVVAFRGASRWQAVAACLIAAVAGLALFIVRLGTEQWRVDALVDGEAVDSPALRLWVNLVALMVLVVLAFAARLLVRDLTGGRRSLSLRLVLVAVLGLGLARTYAFVANHRDEVRELPAAMTYGSDGRAAAEWVRDHSAPTERVMTNAHCGPARSSARHEECNASHFWISALTQRRVVLEGWAFTARSGDWTDPFWGSLDLLIENDRIFTDPSESTVRSFASEHEVTWLFVDRREPADLLALEQLPSLDLTFIEGDYAVLRVVPH